jgi:signal transduction histidine kinase
MRLRSYLLGLTLAATLPVVAFAIVVVVLTIDRERETIRETAQARALTLLTAVEAELRNSISTLEALAAEPSLTDDNLAYFRRVAAAVLASQPDWVDVDIASAAGEKFDPRQVSWIGDLQLDEKTRRWVYPVRTQVVRNGATKYVLSAAVSTDSINDVLKSQKLPAKWGVAILDRNFRFVGRGWEPEKYVGQSASQSLRAALSRASSGYFEGRTVEGINTYSAFWRSEKHGWAVSMGFPTSEITAATLDATWMLALGMLGALALSGLLAHVVARRIAQPMAALASATEEVGRGGTASMPDSQVSEIRVLSETWRDAARAIGERQAALRSADKAKDEFLAMLSHELRNPLAALTASAHVLKIAPPGEEAADKARKVIERQSRQMTRLIEDLLDVSRITMGKATLELTDFDLADLVRDTVRTWRQAGTNPIEVSLPGVAVPVHADRARIEQILSNLLSNATKFSPKNALILVGLALEGDRAVLSVADRGQGIPIEEIDTIFELFVQGEHGPDRAKSGLGLGLALVKRLAEMHGGGVAVASAGPGRGSTFSVRLPLAGASAGATTKGESISGTGRRILVIEDNEDVRNMLRAMLSLHGHEVHEASDGATGIASVHDRMPDVALIDIGLPDVDGYEVARRLRQVSGSEHVKLVAITGYGQPDDRQRALDAGFDAHLTKPVALGQLERTLAAML